MTITAFDVEWHQQPKEAKHCHFFI
jgi:hypothetical protein